MLARAGEERRGMGVTRQAINEEVCQLRALLPAEGLTPLKLELQAAQEDRRRGGRGQIAVFCRFRRAPGEEPHFGLTDATVAERPAAGGPGGQTFLFDKVFGPEASQASVYSCVEHIVQGVLSGINGAVLCYGQTSAGKTFTMEGPPSCCDSELYGVIPRALATLFGAGAGAAEDSDGCFSVRLSMLEIYMERLRDLLLDAGVDTGDIQIKTDRGGFVHVQGLSSVAVGTLEEALSIFRSAQSRRVVSATNMNAQSSRSHCVFMIQVERKGGALATCAKLCLADLAGSEKWNKSQIRPPHGRYDLAASAVIGEEAKHINTSLSTLGCVILSLSRGEEYVPFRNSKLTRVLQDAVSGLASSALIVNCVDSWRHRDETLSTLRFGACATRITAPPAAAARASRAALLLRTLRAARGELERLGTENLQRSMQSPASEGTPPQWTPRRIQRGSMDELGPLMETPQCPPPPMKRWDVGRSSSPVSTLTVSESSSSCSRGSPLSRARLEAKLQRRAVPPIPCPFSAQQRAAVRDMPGTAFSEMVSPGLMVSPRVTGGLSPLSLSPGPSTARPTPRLTPRAHFLSPATPLTPEACTVVETVSDVQDPPQGLPLHPHGSACWEWPLTERQVLERELANMRHQLVSKLKAEEAHQAWVSWLQAPAAATVGPGDRSTEEVHARGAGGALGNCGEEVPAAAAAATEAAWVKKFLTTVLFRAWQEGIAASRCTPRRARQRSTRSEAVDRALAADRCQRCLLRRTWASWPRQVAAVPPAEASVTGGSSSTRLHCQRAFLLRAWAHWSSLAGEAAGSPAMRLRGLPLDSAGVSRRAVPGRGGAGGPAAQRRSLLTHRSWVLWAVAARLPAARDPEAGWVKKLLTTVLFRAWQEGIAAPCCTPKRASQRSTRGEVVDRAIAAAQCRECLIRCAWAVWSTPSAAAPQAAPHAARGLNSRVAQHQRALLLRAWVQWASSGSSAAGCRRCMLDRVWPQRAALARDTAGHAAARRHSFLVHRSWVLWAVAVASPPMVQLLPEETPPASADSGGHGSVVPGLLDGSVAPALLDRPDSLGHHPHFTAVLACACRQLSAGLAAGLFAGIVLVEGAWWCGPEVEPFS
uniref:Kinesin motor domain-containing protein n=1 Tax=Alexandrium monilatum TaxID=311494 RepID=A0A7S4VFH4_9DINO